MGVLDTWDWSSDGWVVAAGVLAAVAAALPGNFLVLRRLSLLGDAISHAVLPGLAAGFLLTGNRHSVPMFLGAAGFGVLTTLLTEWIRGAGRVDEGASMGVVFTSLFAVGLLMVAAADTVELDPACVLYGAIELVPLNDTVPLLGLEPPFTVVTLAVVASLNLLFVVAFFKELKIAAFDPSLATTIGMNATLMHYLLMVVVAVTAVACFESVGNILVVAMLVVPPATAYLLTDRLPRMVALSAVIAAASAVLGHLGAIAVPAWFGLPSTTTASMMAVSAGAMLALAVLLAPRHGVLVRLARQRLLALRILADDAIAMLYREQEGVRRDRGAPEGAAVDRHTLRRRLLAGRVSTGLVLAWLRRRGLVAYRDHALVLTPSGAGHARRVVRSHRLWEQYLATEAGIHTNRLHEKAERLEHFTSPQMRDRLSDETGVPTTDPHGRPIPSEEDGRRRGPPPGRPDATGS